MKILQYGGRGYVPCITAGAAASEHVRTRVLEYLLSPLTVHVIVPPFLKNMLHVELILFGK